ncbi:MAG: SUMF1/EgtB/PvdO family nonheme iron enzyme [Dokdonella sp.]|nr:MAG: SUMF1/EgtB/PvdO family nonheme iron enzyme [Dokdonella sp.]
MPRTEVTRKQHTWGGAAGMVVLGLALLYRFFPDLLQLQPLEPAPRGTSVAAPGGTRATTWTAVEGGSGAVVTPAEPDADADGTSLIDAIRMGPPAPLGKETAALLAKARKAEGAGALLEPGEAIALYQQVLAAAPTNVEAQMALERIGGATRDWTLAAVSRGDEKAAQRYLAAYEKLPHSDKELDAVRQRVALLHEVLPLLGRAAALLKQGKVEGGNDSALAVYRQVLKLDPANVLADAGLAGIERRHLDRALAQAAQDDFAGGDATLAAAASIRPGSQAMLETHTRVDDLRRQRAASVLAQARSALDAGNADLAEELARRAQETSPDLAGLDEFAQRLRNARLYASYTPGQVLRDRFIDISGSAPAIVVIPTGEFVMGSPADEEGHLDSEQPQRRVHIRNGFALGQDEVTVGQFRAFVAAAGYVSDAERLGNAATYDEGSGRMNERRGMSWRNAYDGSRARDDLPVVNVSWNDATAYVRWLAQHTGKHYRLPSEAEFEYALRAGSNTRYPWGDGSPDKVLGNLTGEGDRSPSKRAWAHYFPRYSDGYWGPAPVGKFAPNAYGLLDIDGNVSEWVEDCWHDNYTRAPRDSSAWINPGCERRVVRGGSWGSDPLQVRSAFRTSAQADARNARVGFRVARDL